MVRLRGSEGRERVAVLAGSGLTARRVIVALRNTGVHVRPLSRHPHGSDPDALSADLKDVGTVAAALEGIDRLYLIPPRLHPYEQILMGTALEGARRAGVRHVIFHSVLHPHQPEMPHHIRKLDAELQVRRSGIPWTILQPASYAQNVLARVARVDGELLLASGWPSDSPGMAVVDLDDVASVAAQVCADDSHIAATYELAGPETLTLAQMADVLSGHFGESVRAATRDPRDFAAADASAQEVHDTVAYHRAYGLHGVPGNPHVLEAVLGRSATRFREVVAREVPLQSPRRGLASDGLAHVRS